MSNRLLLFLLAATMASVRAQNATQAGTFVVEHPTLLNLGFEWSISGDANRNATVAVKYRRRDVHTRHTRILNDTI